MPAAGSLNVARVEEKRKARGGRAGPRGGEWRRGRGPPSCGKGRAAAAALRAGGRGARGAGRWGGVGTWRLPPSGRRGPGGAQRSARPSAARRPLLGAGASAAGSGTPRAKLQIRSASTAEPGGLLSPLFLNPEPSEPERGGALLGFGLVSSRCRCHKRGSPSEDEFVGCGDRYPKIFVACARGGNLGTGRLQSLSKKDEMEIK